MAENRHGRPDYSEDMAPKSKEPGDPLAELARLIGQSDPFADGARKPQPTLRADQRAAPEWLSRPAADETRYGDSHASRGPAAGYRDERYADDASYQAQDSQAGHYAQGAGGYDHDPQGASAHDQGAYQPDQRYRVAPPPPEDYDDSYYAEDGHMPPQGEDGYAPSRRRGGLVTIAAVLGLAVIGTAGAFGYRAFTSGPSTPATPPVIKADTAPAKIVPPAPALASADSQGKPFQDRIGAPAAPERIVSREEQPVSLPVTRPAAPPQNAFASANPAAPPPLVAPPPSTAPGAFNEPKRVRTQTIRPDSGGNDLTASAPPAAPRGSAAKQSAPVAIVPPVEPAPRANANTKMAARTPAPAAGGAYVVQVSAQKTEAEAQSSYRALQQKYPAVLAGREPMIRRAEIGQSGTWYRVQVGSFSTSEQASAFCNNLKDAGGQCIVQRN